MKLFAAVLLVAASVTAAAADDSKPTSDARDMAASDCARARKLHKQCVLSFGTEEVEGGVIKPDGTDVGAQGTTTFGSLIHLRYDFRAEIIKAAEDL